MWLRKLRSQRPRDLGQGQARLSARSGCGLSALSHGEVTQLSLLPPNFLPHRPPVRGPSPTNQAENKINSQQSFLLPMKRLKLLAGRGVHGERGWGIQKVVAHVCLGLCDPCSRSQTARRADGGQVTPVWHHQVRSGHHGQTSSYVHCPLLLDPIHKRGSPAPLPAQAPQGARLTPRARATSQLSFSRRRSRPRRTCCRLGSGNPLFLCTASSCKVRSGRGR